MDLDDLPADRPTSVPPEVPGCRAGPPVGVGPHAPAWAATTADGQAAVLHLLRWPAGERGAVVLRRLRALGASPHPHLARILQVHPCGPGHCAVVSQAVTGPSLEDVVAERGPLPRHEVASLGRAVGRALHHLHRRGIVHGNITPGSVLLPADGPVLVDLAGEVAGGGAGTEAPERLAGAPGSAAGDVWALARTLHTCAPTDPAVTAALAPALAADPRHRPGASWFEELDVGGPEPGSGRPATGRRRRRTRPRRRPVLGARRHRDRTAARRGRRSARRRRPTERWRPRLVAALTLLVSASLGGAVTTVVLSRSPTGMEDVVTRLVADRDRALVTRDAGMLASVTVPGSAAARADAALREQLEATATRLTHLHTDVESVRVLDHGTTSAVAEVVLRQGASRRHRAGDVEPVPAQPPRCVRLTLAGPDPWRVRTAARCPDVTG